MNLGLLAFLFVGFILVVSVLLLGHRYGKMRKRVGGPEHIIFGPGMMNAFGSGIAGDMTRHPVIGYAVVFLLVWFFFRMGFYIAGFVCVTAVVVSFLIGRLYPISKEAREELANLRVHDLLNPSRKRSSLREEGARPGWTSWLMAGLILLVLVAVYIEFYLRATVV